MAEEALKGAVIGAITGTMGGAFNGALEYYEENGTLDGSTSKIIESASDGFMKGTASGAASGVASGAMKYMKNPNGYCFIAGTIVATVLGFAAIETIQAGDYVLAKDVDTGIVSYEPVRQTFVREVDETYTITIDGEEIETTAEHPFYVENEGFVQAQNLEAGDNVETADGLCMNVEMLSSGTGGRHRLTDTFGRNMTDAQKAAYYAMTPRQALAHDVADLILIYKSQGLYEEIRPQLRQFIKTSIEMYLELFGK